MNRVHSLNITEIFGKHQSEPYTQILRIFPFVALSLSFYPDLESVKKVWNGLTEIYIEKSYNRQYESSICHCRKEVLQVS